VHQTGFFHCLLVRTEFAHELFYTGNILVVHCTK
jgi:hypothetical protein